MWTSALRPRPHTVEHPGTTLRRSNAIHACRAGHRSSLLFLFRARTTLLLSDGGEPLGMNVLPPVLKHVLEVRHVVDRTYSIPAATAKIRRNVAERRTLGVHGLVDGSRLVMKLNAAVVGSLAAEEFQSASPEEGRLPTQEGNLSHIVVVAHHEVTGRSVNSHTVADVEGVLDKDEDDGLEEFLSRGLENPCETQNDNLVELLNHRVKILERCGDGLLFEVDFVAHSFEFVNRDITVHVFVKHHEGSLSLLFAAKDSFHVLLIDQILALSNGTAKFGNNPARVLAINFATDQIVSDPTSNIADLVQGLARVILECLHRGLRAADGVAVALEEIVGLFVVHFGMLVKVNKLANVGLVIVDSSCVGSCVESKGDPLDKNLFYKVESGQSEQGNDDFVHDVDPVRFAVSEVVVCHGGLERDEDGQKPEEDGCWGQDTCYHARNPEDSPNDLEPNTKPHEINAVHISSLALGIEHELTQQDWDKKESSAGNHVEDISDESRKLGEEHPEFQQRSIGVYLPLIVESLLRNGRIESIFGLKILSTPPHLTGIVMGVSRDSTLDPQKLDVIVKSASLRALANGRSH
ncbi:hypothetical protein HG530_008780 [Fusarium avenaceum]|nr:hypothetical protein HG530_008780 [Fusarium avenaceum]